MKMSLKKFLKQFKHERIIIDNGFCSCATISEKIHVWKKYHPSEDIQLTFNNDIIPTKILDVLECDIDENEKIKDYSYCSIQSKDPNYQKFFKPEIIFKDDIIQWIKDYFEENGKDCFAIIGISGGKDSSVVAALCVEALGKDKVIGVLMPQKIQPDIEYSYDICKHLNIEYVEVNIGKIMNEFIMGIPLPFNDIATINTPARIRMAVLYAISAMVRGRVANTCNLSEDYVGYATKFGDGAGDFSPLMNLTVQEVKEVGRQLKLPSRFIEKVPIDGLCGKTDEDNLGFTYDILDKYIRTGEIDNTKIKEKIDHLHIANKHKLELMKSFKP